MIQDLSHWREILTQPYWPPPAPPDLYRPLLSFLHLLEYALGGGSPLVFRLVSCLLYAGVCLAVLHLAARLVPFRYALGAALLFAAHPVHVEAVALGVTQNELIVGLLAGVMMMRYLDRRRSGEPLRPGDWALLGGLTMAAALFKETGLVLPGLLLASELLLIPGDLRSRARSLWKGYAVLLGAVLLVVLARSAVLAGRLEPGVPADQLIGLSVGSRLLTVLKVVPQYARLLLWPAQLSSDYAPQQLTSSTGFGAGELLGLVLVIGCCALVWSARRKAPVVSFGVLWILIGLFPVSNIVVPTGVLLAERTLFLPSIGLVLAIGGGIAALIRGGDLVPRFRVLAYWSLLGIVVLAGTIRSVIRLREWRSETALAYRTARTAPRSWRAQMGYGNALMEDGLTARGVEAYQRSIALAPRDLAWRSRNKLAEWLYAGGADSAAVAELRLSLQERPDKRETWHFLVLGYLSLGEYPIAARLADSALALGGSAALFGPLRAVADTALREKWPPGSIRIRTSR